MGLDRRALALELAPHDLAGDLDIAPACLCQVLRTAHRRVGSDVRRDGRDQLSPAIEQTHGDPLIVTPLDRVEGEQSRCVQPYDALDIVDPAIEDMSSGFLRMICASVLDHQGIALDAQLGAKSREDERASDAATLFSF
jgi:hypothetical protein